MSTLIEKITHSETWVGVFGEIVFPPTPIKEIFHVTSKQPYTPTS